jgi:protein phosphatase
VFHATTEQADSRRALVKLSREHDVLPAAVVLDVSYAVRLPRNGQRKGRMLDARVVVRRRPGRLCRPFLFLRREGVRRAHVLRGRAHIVAELFKREPPFTDLLEDTGPFDVIGDVHGCLGAAQLPGCPRLRDHDGQSQGGRRRAPSAGAEGSVCRGPGGPGGPGPDTPGVLRPDMGCRGPWYSSPPNRQILGRGAILSRWTRFPTRAGRRQAGGGPCGTAGGPSRACIGQGPRLAVYGDTTGDTGACTASLPARLPWAADYGGAPTVPYDHTPTLEGEWINGTRCRDTGAAFGGKPSALRYPE